MIMILKIMKHLTSLDTVTLRQHDLKLDYGIVILASRHAECLHHYL